MLKSFFRAFQPFASAREIYAVGVAVFTLYIGATLGIAYLFKKVQKTLLNLEKFTREIEKELKKKDLENLSLHLRVVLDNAKLMAISFSEVEALLEQAEKHNFIATNEALKKNQFDPTVLEEIKVFLNEIEKLLESGKTLSGRLAKKAAANLPFSEEDYKKIKEFEFDELRKTIEEEMEANEHLITSLEEVLQGPQGGKNKNAVDKTLNNDKGIIAHLRNLREGAAVLFAFPQQTSSRTEHTQLAEKPKMVPGQPRNMTPLRTAKSK